MQLQKLNSIGIAHFLLPLAVVVAAGVIGSFIAVKSQSSASGTSVKLSPKSFKVLDTFDKKQFAVIKDGKKDTAVLLKAPNTAGTLGPGAAKVELRSNKKLKKLILNNPSRKAKVCIVARAAKSSRLQFSVVNMTSSKTAGIQKRISLGKKNKKQCYNFTIAKSSFIGNGKYSSIAVINDGAKANPAYNVIVDDVTFSLR